MHVALADTRLDDYHYYYHHQTLHVLQADAGAQAVQIFDSWASNLAPQDYDIFAGPYINQIVDSVKQTHPDLPLILYISGSGGLLERMAKCNVEIISIDGSVDMRDAIRRVGPNFAVQVHMLPASEAYGPHVRHVACMWVMWHACGLHI